MGLTQEELTVAIACTLKYPPGHGFSFFGDTFDTSEVYEAAERIEREPSCIALG